MMKTAVRFTLLTFIIVSFAMAQTAEMRNYWIFLGKKDTTLSVHQFTPQALGISDRAMKRRAKALPPGRLTDEYDVPVPQTVIDKIKRSGVRIRTVSRWLNAVSVEGTEQQIQTVRSLPDVRSCENVETLKRSEPLPEPGVMDMMLTRKSGSTGLDYGFSQTQLTNMNAIALHSAGVNGTGVLIAMLDDGFNNYRTHNALKNIKVEDTYDFIHNIKDVSRQPYESAVQGNHGSGTLSAAGGFEIGNMIGAAYGASFILAKTEMDSSGSSVDFHTEEDTYVAALEWAERLGADITSSSLGYKYFLSAPFYTTSDLDGRTTKVAQAAVIAARKNVIVVTAMGNDGYISGRGSTSQHADSTLVSPADADSILSVGAASSDGELAAFSGTGPTADGRIKPEVVAQGMGVYWVNGYTTTDYQTANGTSCSTPLVAGAAALVLSAHPDFTCMQVRQALMNTANRRVDGTFETSFYPNNYYGNGFVNAYAAALSLGPIFSNSPEISANGYDYIISTFVIPKDSPVGALQLHYSIDGSGFETVPLARTVTQNQYSCRIPRFSTNATAVGYFTMQDSSGRSYKFPPSPQAPDTLKPNTLNPDTLISFRITLPEKFELMQNYPNPFNSGTMLMFDVSSEENFELAIFNILGQKIKTLFFGKLQTGTYSLQWDGTNERGCRVSSGIYISRLRTSNAVLSKKMLYVK